MVKGEGSGAHRLRWFLLALLFGSTVLNYLDRQALSILATTIQADLHISDIAYAYRPRVSARLHHRVFAGWPDYRCSWIASSAGAVRRLVVHSQLDHRDGA
jgi:hypothetical protein